MNVKNNFVLVLGLIWLIFLAKILEIRIKTLYFN